MLGLGLLALVLLWGCWIAWQAESWILQAYGAKLSMPPGFAVMLQAVSSRPLRVFIYDDPFPSVLVARSVFRSGGILISRGVLHLLADDELEAMLRSAAQRLRSPILPLQTFLGGALLTILKFAPVGWTEAIVYQQSLPLLSVSRNRKPPRFGVLSGFRFLLVYPWIHLVLRMGSKEKLLGAWEVEGNFAWRPALQKIRRRVQLMGQVQSCKVPFLHLPLSSPPAA